MKKDSLILEAIEVYNLSSLEEFYFDENYRLRARGFIYDEDTGIFVNEYGQLELGVANNKNSIGDVRTILNFSQGAPKKRLLRKTKKAQLLQKVTVA